MESLVIRKCAECGERPVRVMMNIGRGAEWKPACYVCAVSRKYPERFHDMKAIVSGAGSASSRLPHTLGLAQALGEAGLYNNNNNADAPDTFRSLQDARVMLAAQLAASGVTPKAYNEFAAMMREAVERLAPDASGYQAPAEAVVNAPAVAAHASHLYTRWREGTDTSVDDTARELLRLTRAAVGGGAAPRVLRTLFQPIGAPPNAVSMSASVAAEPVADDVAATLERMGLVLRVHQELVGGEHAYSAEQADALAARYPCIEACAADEDELPGDIGVDIFGRAKQLIRGKKYSRERIAKELEQLFLFSMCQASDFAGVGADAAKPNPLLEKKIEQQFGEVWGRILANGAWRGSPGVSPPIPPLNWNKMMDKITSSVVTNEYVREALIAKKRLTLFGRLLTRKRPARAEVLSKCVRARNADLRGLADQLWQMFVFFQRYAQRTFVLAAPDAARKSARTDEREEVVNDMKWIRTRLEQAIGTEDGNWMMQMMFFTLKHEIATSIMDVTEDNVGDTQDITRDTFD